MNDELRGELRGALARAYCTKENENKELDSVLLEAMLPEVIQWAEKYALSCVPEKKKYCLQYEDYAVGASNDCREQMIKNIKGEG